MNAQGVNCSLPRVWPVDWCHIGFLVGSTVLLVLFRDVAPGAWAWMGVNIALLAGQGAVCLWTGGARSFAGAAQLRLLFLIAVVPIVFTQLGSLVPYVNDTPWEQRLFDADLFLCGGVNPVEACEAVANPLLTEVLQWIYDFYFFIPILLGVVVARLGHTRLLVRMMFALVLCVYLSYVGYYIVPVTGPNIDKLGLYDFDTELPGLFLATELRLTLFELEKIKQDCFPSGHTALSLLALMLAWRYHRRAVPLLAPFVIGLIFSTVYLRYHYVVDVVGGIILAVATHYAALVLHRPFDRRVNGFLGEVNEESG